MAKELRGYQQKANDECARAYAAGYRKLVLQLATGAGKTVTACALIKRFYNAMQDKNILFMVHRDPLLRQFQRTLLHDFGLASEAIVNGVRFRSSQHRINVAMVETANNRLKKDPDWFGDVGLLIIDECHIGSFTKIHEYFPNAFIIGLTATPISSNKKHPLKDLYQEIITGIDIPDLIKEGALTPNITYHIDKQVSRKDLSIKNGEFDAVKMSNVYSKPKHIQNCIKAYRELSEGEKAIVFNCNVEHSKLVTQAFVDAGYNARHMDGEMPEAEKDEILKWFAETDDAVLCNIGILTAGFDEPSILTVIVNRATLSLPLWLQMSGRGSRIYIGKTFFKIIDLGGNAEFHGDWCTPRDWRDIFHNPKKAKNDEAVAPIKMCVSCAAIISASSRKCFACGAEQPVKEVDYDPESVEFVQLKNDINIQQLEHMRKVNGWSDFFTVHSIKKQIINSAVLPEGGMNRTVFLNLYALFEDQMRDVARLQNRRMTENFKTTLFKIFTEEVEKVHSWAYGTGPIIATPVE